MKIPKKITPDFLRETIVQVVFESNCAPELMLGLFSECLEDAVTFISGSVTTQTANNELRVEQGAVGYFVDKDERVKISVTPNSFVFNSLESYPGWSEYFPVVKTVLNKAFEGKLVEQFQRVGVRYISEFEDTSIFDNILFDLKLADMTKFGTSQFRTEFETDGLRIVLNLANNVTRFGNPKPVSSIDTDVISAFKLTEPAEVFSIIEDAHLKQKETFFSLLKSEFLKSLNPEY